MARTYEFNEGSRRVTGNSVDLTVAELYAKIKVLRPNTCAIWFRSATPNVVNICTAQDQTADTIYIQNDHWNEIVGTGYYDGNTFQNHLVPNESIQTTNNWDSIYVSGGLSPTVVAYDGISYYLQYGADNSTDIIIYTELPITTIYVNGEPQITYNWTSVPAISGKMGILSLSTVDDTNDGEIVTDATDSDVTLPSGSNLYKLLSNSE